MLGNPSLSRHIRLSGDVQQALGEGRPIVALESTIITHGMPWPQNARIAQDVAQVVRARGAIPATIAVVDGVICVGLDDGEVDSLAQTKGAHKLSRDNLAAAVATGRTGSTTVAATMLCAHLSGIGVFATGGIGGVHRGVEATLDISADLEEFSRSPVTVVCAGAKALLDLPRTLEYLETRGVPVVGYGSDEFAAFWSRSSGIPLQIRLDTPEEVARFLAVRRDLGLTEGVLVSNPLPGGDEIAAPDMEVYIAEALEAARAERITGKAVTPFLLAKLYELTEGRSLAANMALIRNNAGVAADIAVAVADLSPALALKRPHRPLRELEV